MLGSLATMRNAHICHSFYPFADMISFEVSPSATDVYCERFLDSPLAQHDMKTTQSMNERLHSLANPTNVAPVVTKRGKSAILLQSG